MQIFRLHSWWSSPATCTVGDFLCPFTDAHKHVRTLQLALCGGGIVLCMYYVCVCVCVCVRVCVYCHHGHQWLWCTMRSTWRTLMAIFTAKVPSSHSPQGCLAWAWPAHLFDSLLASITGSSQQPGSCPTFCMGRETRRSVCVCKCVCVHAYVCVCVCVCVCIYFI